MEDVSIKIKREKIVELLSQNKRLDGRGLSDYRKIVVETGVLDKAVGSANVSLGNTKVMVGIKIEIGEPFPDTPTQGVLTVNAELVPLASPTFEAGPPSEDAIELSRIIDRGIRGSEAIDLDKLCIEAGKKVFVIFVDIYILDYDGNLFDASALACTAALNTAKIQSWEMKENGELELKSELTSLPLKHLPIAITMAKINEHIIVDPSIDEEKAADASLTMTMDSNSNLCAIQKTGVGSFTVESVLQAEEIARAKAIELRKLVLTGAP